MLKAMKLGGGLLVAVIILLGNLNQAEANLTLSLSAGSGWQVDQPDGRIPTNIMIAPGLELLEHLLSFELGFVADLGDVEARDFDFQIRPMAILELPMLPIYGRLVTGITQLANGPIGFAFGGTVGIIAHLSRLNLFAEAGYVPVARDGDFVSNFEGRAGVGVTF